MTGEILREDVAGADWSGVSAGERIGPVPPGDVLRLEFLEPLGVGAEVFGRELGPEVPLLAILDGDCAITAAVALRLASRLGTSAEFWMNLQTAHDLDLARLAAAA